MTVPNHQDPADLDLLALAGLTLVLRCGRCRTRLDRDNVPHGSPGGFLWPCPACEPAVYAHGYWAPTRAPEWFRPGDVRFVGAATP